jgi:hypothetical protein
MTISWDMFAGWNMVAAVFLLYQHHRVCLTCQVYLLFPNDVFVFSSRHFHERLCNMLLRKRCLHW